MSRWKKPETVRRLAQAQKTSKGAPAYSRFVNRKAGRYLAAVAYRSGRTPNQVTTVSAAFSAVAIALAALLRPRCVGVVVSVLLAVGYAFDSADGQLARLRGGGTPAGEWLDHVVDSAKICALHLAVLVSFYRFGDRSVTASSPSRCCGRSSRRSASSSSSSTTRSAGLTGPRAAGDGRRLGGPQPAGAPTDYGVLLLSFLLFGWHDGFFAVYARSSWRTPRSSRWRS